MRIKTKFSIIIISFVALSITACKKQPNFVIDNFTPFVNYTLSSDTLHITMDLNNTLVNGIRLPSENSNKKYFNFHFSIKNTSATPKKYSYKIYYQNETYKHSEVKKIGPFSFYNKPASENFYGSWQNTGIEFKQTNPIPNDGTAHFVIDSFCIVGNPRNESKYFGAQPINKYISPEEISRYCKFIEESESWMQQVKEKAKVNNISIEKQLIEDAKWTINKDRVIGNENNRWKRNPRTGMYHFMLVVSEEQNLNEIPEYIRNIAIADSSKQHFVNPFYYFKHKKANSNTHIAAIASQMLKTKAHINLKNGIYYNPSHVNYDSLKPNSNKFCAYSDSMFYSANLEQFFHNINQNYRMDNIPVVADVVNDNYTRSEYQKNADTFNKASRTATPIAISHNPGTTVGFDSTKNAIYLKNPGNQGSERRKENVGVKTRHGFTYGKFRAKICFPEIINTDYVWNGITCAFWLIYQPGEWNKRCACNEGYNPVNKKNPSTKIPPTEDYAEIDIEIVKTSKYWPQSSYGFFQEKPTDDALNNNVIITCTNWDLACHDPKNYNVGVKKTSYENQNFFLHRWDHWYKALTLKTEYPQALTLGKPFYYEIEWKPNEIIWRIGETKDDMQVIGYMNNTNTKIPNNQMLAVVTQEYHDETWWPTAPFGQNNIPFPKNDIRGYIYEIEIE